MTKISICKVIKELNSKVYLERLKLISVTQQIIDSKISIQSYLNRPWAHMTLFSKNV